MSLGTQMTQHLVYRERSVVLNEVTAEIMSRTIQKDPQLFEMEADELRAHLRAKRMAPSPTAGMLRVQFWREYDRVQGGEMLVANIYRDVCQWGTWDRVIKDPYSLAWILSPPASMIAQCDERIDTLMSNMRDVVQVSPVKNGVVDRHLAKLQFEILMYFDQRKHGAIVQKIEQTTKSTSVTHTVNHEVKHDSEKIAEMMGKMSHEEIREKLEAAKRASGELPVIEVKAE